MKLRQKLAAVLAATMMVTAVPVVTMAASDLYTQKVIQVVENNKEDGFDATVVIDLKDAITTSENVYLELQGAEFDQAAQQGVSITGATVSDVQANDMTLKLSAQKAGKIYVPIKSSKLTADEAKVTVVGTEVVSDGSTVVAKVVDVKPLVTAGTAKIIYDGGTVADIVIDEPIAGTLGTDTIVLELDNSDFDFDLSSATAVGSRGLSGVTVKPVADGKDTAKITLPKTTTETGRLTIKNVKVDLKQGVKAPSLGDVEVTVRSKDNKFSDQTVKVAEVKKYGSTLNVTKEAEVLAGKDAEVEVVLKETIAGETFRPGKKVEFTLDNGFFMNTPSFDAKELTFVEFLDADGKTVKAGEDAVTMVATMGTLNTTTNNYEAKDEIKFNAKVGTSIATKDDVILSASGRGMELEEAAERKIATVKSVFEVDSVQAVVKAGLNKQKAGKITINETEKGKMDDITIKIDAEDSGITFAEKPVVEGKNITLGTVTQNKTTSSELNVTIPVTRSSKENGSVEIKDIPVNVSRMAPEGAWNLEISMDGYHGKIKVEDFLAIGTPNTEDLAANGLKKGVAEFKVGSNKYTVNGQEKEMDAKAYVSSKGRTMIPVRYLSDAFGVDGKDIMFSNGTIVIIAGNKTIQLTNGSDTVIVNGASLKIDEKVTIKDNRTYVPVSQIGLILGVEAQWSQATQTATFTNK